jgi:hypothetical protein
MFSCIHATPHEADLALEILWDEDTLIFLTTEAEFERLDVLGQHAQGTESSSNLLLEGAYLSVFAVFLSCSDINPA